MVSLTFLGTSDSVPTPTRNHTAILLTHDDENILIDCGEGTQRQFRKAHLNLGKLTKILITHWHGDHTLGLPGVLQSLALFTYTKELSIFGPEGIKTQIASMLRAFPFMRNYELSVHEASGTFYEDDRFTLTAHSVSHGIPCNAYTFVLKGKRRIDKQKLSKYKIPEGPHLQKLKEGKSIVVGKKTYRAKDLTNVEPDQKVAIVLDTQFVPTLVSFVKDADILISEATFDSTLSEKAHEHKHMTAREAATLAKKANVKKLILTHVSQRYETDREIILKDAKSVFKDSFLVNDLDHVEL